MNTYCGTGLANPRNPRGLTIAWDHNVYAKKEHHLKYATILTLVVIVVALLLSWLASVPYIYTLCGFSAWAAVGHLITIDDDYPGGFSNPEKDNNIWRHSLLELAIKTGILCILVVAAFYPQISHWGR